MAKFQYKTVTLRNEEGRDIDLDVEPLFDELQEDGWEYVSGPAILSRVYGEEAYVFMVRKPAQYESAYADHDLIVV